MLRPGTLSRGRRPAHLPSLRNRTTTPPAMTGRPRTTDAAHTTWHSHVDEEGPSHRGGSNGARKRLGSVCLQASTEARGTSPSATPAKPFASTSRGGHRCSGVHIGGLAVGTDRYGLGDRAVRADAAAATELDHAVLTDRHLRCQQINRARPGCAHLALRGADGAARDRDVHGQEVDVAAPLQSDAGLVAVALDQARGRSRMPVTPCVSQLGHQLRRCLGYVISPMR